MEVTTIETNKLEFEEKFETSHANEFLLNKLRTSIQRFGQIELAHVIPHHSKPGTYTVVAGKKIVRVLRELGEEKTLCFVHKNYQEGVMALLSRKSIRFETDYFKVAELVKELNQLGVNNQRIQHSVSWTKEELDNMLRMSNFDWETFGEPDEDQNQLDLF